MARIIGIDLGAWSVKATVLEGGFSRFEVVEQTSQLVRHADGQLPDRTAKLAALETILATLGVDDTTLIGTGFPIDQASIRLIQMPFADKNQIAQTLEFEVEGLVPYDLEEMVVAHRIVSTSPDGSAVLTAIAPRDQLGSFIRDFASVNADPKSIVIDGDLLAVYGEYGTEAIIDIGHSRTIVTVAREGSAVYSRGISIGGWHLTQAIAKSAQVGFEEAQEIKHKMSLSTTAYAEWDDEDETQADASPPSPSGNSETDAVRDALRPLLASLRTSLVAYEDATGNEIDRIILAGGSSELVGLLNLLKVEMGVPINKVAPGRIDLHSPYGHTLSEVYANRTAGLCGDSALELRTDEFRYRGNLANLRMLALASAALILVGFLGGIGMFGYHYKQAHARLKQLDVQLAEAVALATGDPSAAASFESPDDALLALQMQTVEASGRIDLLGPIVFGVPPTVTTISQLSSSLPDPTSARIDVTELTLTSQSINMKATTDGYDAAANIESSLAANEKFKGARKGNEKKTALGISFTVTIPLGDEAPGEEG